MESRPVLSRWALAAACAVAMASPGPLVAPANAAGSDPTATPGSLGRIVSWGYTTADSGEGFNGFYTTDPDGSDPAMLIKQQRPYTEQDANAGAVRANILKASVSPDGLHIAVWLTDPDGFVVPGGIADDPYGTERGRTGEALAVFDIDGTFVRLLTENRRETNWATTHDTFRDITWIDNGHVLVPGRQLALAGTEAEFWRGVLRRIDATSGQVDAVITVEDGTPRGKHVDAGWAGGGTIIAVAERSAYVFRPGEDRAELPKALVTDDASHEGYENAAVSPDGQHIAVSYQGPRDDTGTRAQIDVFDHTAPGVWTRRHIDVPGLSREALWPKWLPYSSYSGATLLLPVERPDNDRMAAAVSVAPGVAPADRVVRTFPDAQGPSFWQALPVPAANSGAADVGVGFSDMSTTAGQDWTGTVSLTNRGPAAATGLRIDVDLDGAPAASLSMAGGTCADGHCELATLGAGQSVDIRVARQFVRTGVMPLKATVTTDSLDWNPGNDSRRTGVKVKTPAGGPAVAGRIVHQIRAGGPIVVSNPDGSHAKQLAAPPQGQSISLLEVHANTGLVLWSNDADTYRISDLTGTTVRTFTLAGAVRGVAIAPDGRTVYWSEYVDDGPANTFRLLEKRLDVAGAQPVLRRTWTGSLARNMQVSPDGTQLAYVPAVVGDYTRAVVFEDLDFARPARRVVVAGEGDVRPNNDPAWSPDSSRIAVAVGLTSPFDENGKVLAVHASDGVISTLAPQTRDLWVNDWAPDGSALMLTDLDSSHHLDLATKELKPLSARPSWWSGQALVTTPPVDDPDTTAPTGRFTLDPATYARPNRGVTLTRVSVTDDRDPAADLKVRISWGDGTADTVASGATATVGHTYRGTAKPTVRVTVSDRAGNSTQAHASTLIVDGLAPRIAVTTPTCGKRKARACTSYRSSRAAWSTIRGTLGDTGGSGIATAKARLIQQRGTKWHAFTGRGWSARATQAKALSAARMISLTRPSPTRWSLAAPGLKAGKLVVTLQTTDRSGNVGQGSRTQKLR